MAFVATEYVFVSGSFVGTMSDFHTHAHDLPPQMGGCYSNNSNQADASSIQVDYGPWTAVPDVDDETCVGPAGTTPLLLTLQTIVDPSSYPQTSHVDTYYI